MAIKLELTGKCANCSYIDLYLEANRKRVETFIETMTGDKTLLKQYRIVAKAFERMLMDDQERKTASGEGIEE